MVDDSFVVFNLQRPDLFEDLLIVQVHNLDGSNPDLTLGVYAGNFTQNLAVAPSKVALQTSWNLEKKWITHYVSNEHKVHSCMCVQKGNGSGSIAERSRAPLGSDCGQGPEFETRRG